MENVPMIEFEGLYIPRELAEHVIQYINENNNLEAIRLLREGAGVDLKNAKEAVDSYCKNNTICRPNSIGRKKSKISVKRLLFIVFVLLLVYIFRDIIIDYIKNALFKMMSF